MAKQKSSKKNSNVFFVFDTETTTILTKNQEKHAHTYIIGIKCYLDVKSKYTKSELNFFNEISNKMQTFREWKDFDVYLNYVNDLIDEHNIQPCIIFAHNLGYDLESMIKNQHYKNTSISVKAHSPLSVKCDNFNNLVFRDSFLLFGQSLRKVAERFTDGYSKKDLNYRIERFYDEKQSKKTIKYLERDLDAVAYSILTFNRYGVNIDEKIFNYLNSQIKDILSNWNYDIGETPYTQTSYTRKLNRKVLTNNDRKEVCNFFKKSARMTDIKMYDLTKKAFMGGFVHAKRTHKEMTLENIINFDKKSSYPWVMLDKKFPSSWLKVNQKLQENFELCNQKKWHFIAKIKFYNIKAKRQHTYISESKCEWENQEEKKNTKRKLDNGRILESDYIMTTVCELDYELITRLYNFDKIKIVELIVSKCSVYLPPQLKKIITIYADIKNAISISIKQAKKDNATQKEIEFLESLYSWSKGLLNAQYGINVEKYVKEELQIDETNYEYNKIEISKEEEYTKFLEFFEKSCKGNNLLRSYSVGIYVTAHARYDLLDTALRLEDYTKCDVVYCDTDSLKIYYQSKNEIKNEIIKFFEIENEKYNNVPYKFGTWEREGDYQIFKTLGAKKYITYCNGKLKQTVAGVPKKAVSQIDTIIKRKYNSDYFMGIMQVFKSGFVYKKCKYISDHKKINYEEFEYIDRKGKVHLIKDNGGCILEKSDVALSNCDTEKIEIMLNNNIIVM